MISVGVVIPFYNAGNLLRDAVESVLAQSPPVEQVIAIDDGSTDDTSAIMEVYRGKVEFVRQPNRGPSTARNAGWRHLATDAVVFLDADDLLLPGALATRRSLLREGDTAWAHTEGFLQDPGGERHPFSAAYRAEDNRREGRIFPALLCRNFISMSSTIVLREALEQAGGFDETIRFMEDWDLWLRLAVRFPAAYATEPTFIQRRRTDSLSNNREAMVRSRYRILVKIHHLFPREVVAAGWRARRSVADAYNAAGYARVRQRQWREARPCLWQSVGLWPWQGRAWFLLFRSLLARGN